MEKNTKIFVVDSSVFLHDPNTIYAFEQNVVVVPGAVIADLDSPSRSHLYTQRHILGVYKIICGFYYFIGLM